MVKNAILAYSDRCAPEEACGFVVATPQGQQFMPCKNRSVSPCDYFDISPDDYLLACSAGEVVALVHSHATGDRYLSAGDRQWQVKSHFPWWLVHDGRVYPYRCVPHLLGRTFQHGIMDCYSLFQDAYHLAGIDMPDFTREDNWWRQGKNLYLDNMVNTGFYPVKGEIQKGDIILFCYGCSVANHAAIYCGEQMILHHLPNQLSKREVYSERWQRFTHSIWRHNAWQPSSFTGICNDLAASSHSVSRPPQKVCVR